LFCTFSPSSFQIEEIYKARETGILPISGWCCSISIFYHLMVSDCCSFISNLILIPEKNEL
ncbi:hypothetical protein A4A49_60351, partial [Nicotiana attenuata]